MAKEPRIRLPFHEGNLGMINRRSALSAAPILALAACTTAQQQQVTATTAEVVAWLQQSETALETLITVSVPTASQAAAKAALADFTMAAGAVGSAIAGAAPITSIATGVQTAVGFLNSAVGTIGPMLPAQAQAILAAVTLAANLLASFASGVLTPKPTPVPAAATFRGKSALTTVVP